MNRRSFLTAASLPVFAPAAGMAAPPALLRPKLLRRGDRVGIVDPSTAIYDPLAPARIRAVLEALGLTPVFAPHLFDRSRDYDASRRERLSDLHAMFADPNLQGVFCARGGYGISEIVADIDYPLIHANPKVFLGFSDVTLLHLAIRKTTGLVTFHGRMPALRSFSTYSLAALARAIMTPGPLGALHNPAEANPLRPTYPLRTLRPGRAAGPLVGGNLSMIVAAMGTPWEIDTRGAIFFFEDVDEQPYAIGRMLLQLKQAGKLTAVAGVVVGACANCDKTSDSSPYGLDEQFDDILGDLKVPVFSGLALGHTDEQLTVPLGVTAEMDADSCTLTVSQTALLA